MELITESLDKAATGYKREAPSAAIRERESVIHVRSLKIRLQLCLIRSIPNLVTILRGLSAENMGSATLLVTIDNEVYEFVMPIFNKIHSKDVGKQGYVMERGEGGGLWERAHPTFILQQRFLSWIQLPNPDTVT